MTEFKGGDRVRWTNTFLHNTGQAPFGEACRAVATVLEDQSLRGGLSPKDFVVVQWDGRDPSVVNTANVAKARTAKLLDVPVRQTRGSRGR